MSSIPACCQLTDGRRGSLSLWRTALANSHARSFPTARKWSDIRVALPASNMAFGSRCKPRLFYWFTIPTSRLTSPNRRAFVSS